MKSVPIYLSKGFNWRGNAGDADGSKLADHIVGNRQSPDNQLGVFIYSIKSGLVKYFAPVHDEDGYDGEFMLYRNDDGHFVKIWNY